MRKIIAWRIALAVLCVSVLASARGVDPFESEAVQKAVVEVVASLTPSQHQQLLDAKRDELSGFRFSLGARIREHYFAPPPSDVRKAFCGPDPEAYCDMEAASMMILTEAWEHIHAANQ